MTHISCAYCFLAQFVKAPEMTGLELLPKLYSQIKKAVSVTIWYLGSLKSAMRLRKPPFLKVDNPDVSRDISKTFFINNVSRQCS